jgi:subtilase family serine protease
MWSAPLVISSNKHAFIDFPPSGSTDFPIGSEVFVHWAIKNGGKRMWQLPFEVALTLDGELWMTYPVEQLDQNEIARLMNIQLIIDSPGSHQIGIVVDPDNQVTEGIETDNEYFVDTQWIDLSWTPTPTP